MLWLNGQWHANLQLAEAASDNTCSIFVSRIVRDTAAQFCDPGLNSNREIRLQVVGDSILNVFLW